MFKGVIFDLDGTLVNTIKDLCTAVNYGLGKMGFAKNTVEEFISFVGSGTDYMLNCALKENRTDENREKLKEYYLEYYGKHFCDYSCAYAGMPALIKTLKEKGIKTAVVTNKVDVMAATVVENLYGDVFDIIVGQKDNFPLKPDPALTLKVVNDLGLNKEDCAFVGDSDVDIKTGINAGLTPVGVLWGFRDRDVLIKVGARIFAENAEELQKILLGE